MRIRHSRSELDGRPYFFCSESCQKKFRADPLRYGQTDDQHAG
nr:YHS domain-containing protein [Burkholderia cenocepacia]